MDNPVYVQAILNQGLKGKPIFCCDIQFYYLRSRGNKKVKEFTTAKKIVVSGNLEQIKKDPKTLYNCLRYTSSKEDAHKADKSKYGIESIEIVSFHGYSHVH